MKKCLWLSAMVLFVTSLFAGYVSAQDVLPGVDLFETPPGHSQGSPDLPADFFGPGSDPFDGIIALKGKPFDPMGSTDAIIERLSTATLPDPFSSNDTVPIEIIALSLVSVEPITVTYNGGQDPELWDVKVGLSSVATQTQGTMTIFHEYENGGVYYLELPVTTRWVFTRTMDSQEVVFDPAPPEVLTSTEVPAPPVAVENCWSHSVPFPVATSDGSATVDHDVNPATPQVAVGPSSNFVVGGCGFTPTGDRPTDGNPPSTYEKVLAYLGASLMTLGVQPPSPAAVPSLSVLGLIVLTLLLLAATTIPVVRRHHTLRDGSTS